MDSTALISTPVAPAALAALSFVSNSAFAARTIELVHSSFSLGLRGKRKIISYATLTLHLHSTLLYTALCNLLHYIKEKANNNITNLFSVRDHSRVDVLTRNVFDVGFCLRFGE